MVVINDLHFPSSIVVGTSVVEVVPEKTTLTRSVLVLTNTSTLSQRISLGFQANAVDGVGVVLYPGDKFVEVIDQVFKPTNVRITAVASAASGSLAIYERSI